MRFTSLSRVTPGLRYNSTSAALYGQLHSYTHNEVIVPFATPALKASPPLNMRYHIIHPTVLFGTSTFLIHKNILFNCSYNFTEIDIGHDLLRYICKIEQLLLC
jgi:hypothetical protein